MSLPGLRRRRVGAVVAAGLAAAIVLAGCTSGASGGSSGGSGGSATAGTVNWWGWTPDIGVANREIAGFEKQYPNIKVVFKKTEDASYNAAIRPALNSSVGPDVFDMAAGGAVGSVKNFGVQATDLTPAMSKLLGANWKSQLYGPGVTDFTSGGKLLAAPLGKVTSGFLWINQDLFTKYHLTPPTTLAQWINVCKVFRSNGLGCLKEGVDAAGFETDTLHTIANSVQPGFWEKAVTGQAKWTDPAYVNTLTIWKNLQSDGILDPGALGIQQYPDANNAFLSGKAPMVQMGTWYRQYTEKPSLQAAISAAGVSSSTKLPTIVPIPFPNVAGSNPALFGDPDFGLAVSSRSKVQNAATTFALWLTTQRAGQQIVTDNLDEDPVIQGVSPNWSALPLVNPSVQTPALKTLSQKVAGATQPRQANISAALIQAIDDSASTTLAGKATPAQAAATLQNSSGQ